MHACASKYQSFTSGSLCRCLAGGKHGLDESVPGESDSVALSATAPHVPQATDAGHDDAAHVSRSYGRGLRPSAHVETRLCCLRWYALVPRAGLRETATGIGRGPVVSRRVSDWVCHICSTHAFVLGSTACSQAHGRGELATVISGMEGSRSSIAPTSVEG